MYMLKDGKGNSAYEDVLESVRSEHDVNDTE